MKDTIIGIAVAVGLIFGIPFLILWLRDKWQRRNLTPEAIMAQNRRFKERLRSPDIPAIEAHYGCRLPQSLLDLYANQQELMRNDFEVVPPDGSEAVYICFYNPADAANLESPWPGCENKYAFADDGAGNELLVNPRQADPAVEWHDHETGEIRRIAESLSEFMKWERRAIAE